MKNQQYLLFTGENTSYVQVAGSDQCLNLNTLCIENSTVLGDPAQATVIKRKKATELARRQKKNFSNVEWNTVRQTYQNYLFV